MSRVENLASWVCIALRKSPHFEGGYVNKWLSQINHVCDRVVERGIEGQALQLEMELETVRQSLDNLMKYDFIAERVAAGTLKLQGAYFSIIQARLMLSDEAGAFQLVEVAG